MRIKRCRSCGSTHFSKVMSLGRQSLIDFPNHAGSKSLSGPLELVLCDECKLLQLKHTFARNLLYREYWYESKINPTMVLALKDVADAAAGMVKLGNGNVVLDIASNDNTLLRQYSQNGVAKIGIDPSDVARRNIQKGIVTINDFFSVTAFNKAIRQLNGNGTRYDKKASIITCVAIFYDLPSPNAFLEDVKKCLKSDGIFIIQMNYLGLMIKENTFDNICHEHLEYYSFRTLNNLLDRHGFEVLDVELNDVNGGSFRVYIGIKGSRKITQVGKRNIRRLETYEKRLNLDKLDAYREFSRRMLQTKKQLTSFIKRELGRGKKFCLEGASTRGLVQIQFFGLSGKDFQYALEKNPRKFGKYYADTGIPIRSDENFYETINGKLNEESPDYLYVLPYHFLGYIKKQRKDFLKNGGKLIVAIPEFNVIGG